MANIKNNSGSPKLIGGVEIRVGATAAVPNWETIKDTGAIPAWIKGEVITVVGDKPKADAPKASAPKAAEAKSADAPKQENSKDGGSK